MISTLRQIDLDCALARTLREREFQGRVAAMAQSEAEARQLRESGADEIFRPFHDAAEHAANFIASACQAPDAERAR